MLNLMCSTLRQVGKNRKNSGEYSLAKAKTIQKSDLGAILEPSWPQEGTRRPKSCENLIFTPPWPPKLEAKIQQKS